MSQAAAIRPDKDRAGMVALHGVCVDLPPDWEVVGTYGGWRTGHLLAAAGREPALSLSWARHAASPDLSRTLATAGRRIDEGHVSGVMRSQESVGSSSLLGAWDGPHGAFHAGVRYLPEAGLTIVARHLQSGSAEQMRSLLVSARGYAPGSSMPWCMYGLSLVLPGWWRLEGLQHLAGLVRGVWFRYPNGTMRADQVLVMSRLACASRLLAGTTLSSWQRGRLSSHEHIDAQQEDDGVAHLSSTMPSARWWRRLRGRPDRRELYAWTEADGDRLLVQEWKGAKDPLPCLRGW